MLVPWVAMFSNTFGKVLTLTTAELRVQDLVNVVDLDIGYENPFIFVNVYVANLKISLK